MEVQIKTKDPLPRETMEAIEQEFGFECRLERDRPGCRLYYVGYDQDDPDEDGPPYDLMPYDECVRLCGWLRRRGLDGWIDGNGQFEQDMITRLDFTGWSMTEDQIAERTRIARIYWSEADPERLEAGQCGAQISRWYPAEELGADYADNRLGECAKDLCLENAELKADKARLDWLEQTLISLHLAGPYMDGCNVFGQLENKAKYDKGLAGSSYFQVRHRSIREAVDAAMAWPFDDATKAPT